MTTPDCHAIRPDCAYPGDFSPSDDVDVIRFANGSLYVNGYATGRRGVLGPSREAMMLAADVLNVVLDPVPPELVAPFADDVIAKLGPAWTMDSTRVTEWIEQRTGRKVESGRMVDA